MAQYIDKDALVAEIENIRKHYIERDDFDNGWNFALDKVLSFIDTLEVKEVDLEKLSISEQRIKNMIFGFWTGLQTFDTSWYTFADAYSQGIKDILKELGLKAQKGE